MFLADINWPGSILVLSMLSFWPIVLGILVEWPFIAWTLQAPWKASLIATLFVNAFSAILGTLLILWLSLMLLYWPMTSESQGDGILFILTLAVTVGVEVIGLISYMETNLFEKLKISRPSLSRIWLGLTLANFLIVGIAFAFIVLNRN